MLSGLVSLKNIIAAFEYELESERKPLYAIVDLFFPMLENIIKFVSQISATN